VEKMFLSLLKVNLLTLKEGFAVKTKNRSNIKGLGILITALLLYGVGTMVFMFGFGMKYLLDTLATVPYAPFWLYFAMVAFTVFVLSVVTGIFMSQSQLFGARDNEILLPLPIPVRHILGARIAILLFIDFIFSFILHVTALVVYLSSMRLGAVGFVSFFASMILLPFLSFTVSALFGWLINILTMRMKRKNLFAILFSMVFLFGYFYLVAARSVFLPRFF
jgi:ABC-2 type transport system permease protein